MHLASPMELHLWLWVAAIVGVAGVLRGLTGFGAGLIMAPALSLVLGAHEAVALAVTLNTLMLAQLFAPAVKLAAWSVIVPLALATLVGLQVGIHFLIALDPLVVRRIIGIVGIIFSLIGLLRVRLHGYSMPASVAIGAVTGVSLGVAGMGGPPSILYILSGKASAPVKRAIMIVFTGIIQLMAFSSLLAYRVITAGVLLVAVFILPLAIFTTYAGAKLFDRVDETLFERLSLVLMMLISLAAAI